MKYFHPSGASLECFDCSPELHAELDLRLSKLGFSEVPEVPEKEPVVEKKVVVKKKKAAKK